MLVFMNLLILFLQAYICFELLNEIIIKKKYFTNFLAG